MNITNLEMAQFTIELFGGLICFMLAIIVMMNGYERGSWKLLKWLFFSTAGGFFSDACAYAFGERVDRSSVIATRISNFFVFLLNLVLICLFTQYLYKLLQEKGVVPSKVFKRIVCACVLFDLIGLIVNVPIKWIYYFDEGNCYHRNFGWYIFAGLTIVCILTCSIMSIHYRKAVSKMMLSALLFYTFTPFAAIILQIFINGVSIIHFAIFLALSFVLFIYLKEWGKSKETREKKRKSIEFIILFAIMTISMSASIISCIVSINRISQENSESSSLLIAHMVNDGIEKEFIRPIMVAETMSQDYSLKEYMIESGEVSPRSVEMDVASYLDSIRTGFGYQMVYAVCETSKAYYTYDGICEYIDPEKNENDKWYKLFLEYGKHYKLEVDTDEANQWELSVFVNTEITDNSGKLLGVCGVGVKMTELQNFLKQYEEKYNVKIDLIDKEGLIYVDSDAKRIKKEYLNNCYLQNVSSKDFYYEEGAKSSRMIKYMEDLDWYLVVEDRNPNKINVLELTIPSTIIFVIGLMMMGFVFSVISIRERKASRELEEKRKISITDHMTGLFNRRAYDENCVRISESDSLAKFTLIMMDVNGLKTVNDTSGHMAGDEMIIGAANCMLTSMGEYGKLYRTGGDEFVALLECTEEQLQDIIGTFDHMTENWKGTYLCRLSVSKGIVVCKEHPDMSFEEIKELADQLMYQDKDACYKRAGKTRNRKQRITELWNM